MIDFNTIARNAYATDDNTDYTDDQIDNHNTQIDRIVSAAEGVYNDDSAANYEDELIQRLQNFSDNFCNSISERNEDGDYKLYKKYI